MWHSPLIVAKGEIPLERLSKRVSACGRCASRCCAWPSNAWRCFSSPSTASRSSASPCSALPCSASPCCASRTSAWSKSAWPWSASRTRASCRPAWTCSALLSNASRCCASPCCASPSNASRCCASPCCASSSSAWSCCASRWSASHWTACCSTAWTSRSSMSPPGLPGPTPPVHRAHRPSRLPTKRCTTAPRSETLEATGRPNFPEACASSCSVAQTRAYAVRFYACACVPASVVHRVRLLETCNERKEDVGRRVFAVGNALFDRFVLHVVLRRVLVRERVHDVESVLERVVDLDERRPLLRQRVFGKDRLDR